MWWYKKNGIFKRFRKPNYPRRRLKMSNAYNEIELMICTASRIFEDGASVSVGTGIPCAAVMLAQKLYAPNILITFEAGAVAPILPAMPISVGDSTTMHKAFQTSSTCDQMEMIQRGLMDYLFLGGAQLTCMVISILQ